MATPTADELLELSRAVYGTCRSYADSGQVRTVMVHGEHGHERQTALKTFETAFRRPDRFRFEWSEAAVGPPSEWMRMVVWQDASRIRSWWTVTNRVEAHADLSAPLAGAAGVSSLAAWRIPSLLLPDLSPPGHADSTCTRSAATESIEEHECHVIDVASASGGERIWLDVHEHIVRQVRHELVFDARHRSKMIADMEANLERLPLADREASPTLRALEHLRRPQQDFATVSTTLYRPGLNPDIEEDVFAFSPPES